MTRPLKALLFGAGGLACTGVAPTLQDLGWDKHFSETSYLVPVEIGLYLVGFVLCYSSFAHFAQEVNERCRNRPQRHLMQALICGLSGAFCFAAACASNENRLSASTVLALVGFGSGCLAINQLWQALRLRGEKRQDESGFFPSSEERAP